MKRKWLPSLLALGLAIGLIAGGCAPPAAPPALEEKPPEVITWDLSIAWPPGNFSTEGVTEFAELVKERSGGRLKIVVHPGGALGYKATEMLTVVRDGAVPIGEMLLIAVAGDEPLMAFNGLPFLAGDCGEANLLGVVARPYLEEIFTKWNQRLLYWQYWPRQGIYTKHPITTLADLKGVKIRTFDAISTDWVNLAGGIPVALPWGDVYMALATGTIDGLMTSSMSGVDGKLWEQTTYFHDMGFSYGYTAVTVNSDAFEKLPDGLKLIVLETAQEMERKQELRSRMMLRSCTERLKEEGMQVLGLTPELRAECIESSEVIWADWFERAGPDGEAIVNEFLELVGR